MQKRLLYSLITLCICALLGGCDTYMTAKTVVLELATPSPSPVTIELIAFAEPELPDPLPLPTPEPTPQPTQAPTAEPMPETTDTPEPTAVSKKTTTPKKTPKPKPAKTATPKPSVTEAPTAAPKPTAAPTQEPTPNPTGNPMPDPVITAVPTLEPTAAPTPPPMNIPPDINVSGSYNAEDIALAARVAYFEAGKTEEGYRAVLCVIINRVDSGKWPDSVHDVCYQKNQFTVVKGSNFLTKTIPDEVYVYANDVLNNGNRMLPSDVMSFRAGKDDKTWGSRTYYGTYGGNDFYS